MYKKVSTELNFTAREQEILSFWNERDVFKKSIEQREGAPAFTFYDGPPTANGKPHIGHVFTRAVKDAIPRYRTMKGYKVIRKAGWDTHGLPVELEVERQLGLNGKPGIEHYGVEPFIKKCRDSVFKYESEWRQMSERVGFWADMDNPYVTYHDSYIESVWWAIKQISDMGLLYKGHKVVPYCPRCGTALSSHEVAQGYKDVKETSVFVKFKVRGKENEFFLAWTTTPWTLPSNVALVVNAGVNYARVLYKGEVLILAEALVGSVLGEAAEVLEIVKGSALERIKYEPLFDFARTPEAMEKGFYVAADDYVTLTDGSGIVHTAPAFGEDDARVGRLYELPFVQLVNTEGKFVAQAAPFAGMFVKEADPVIVKHLADAGLLFKETPFEHSYPFCWRCDTPLLYYARDTWFIKMTAVKEKLINNNDTVNWYPDNVKRGRFGNFLENVIDWGLSRERYWGTPLPVWECECSYRHVIGSKEELKGMSDNCPDDIELHKPYVDTVTLKCPKCGGVMKRTPEVIDCWFDSGAMPFAQWHYPFENKELFEQLFPADFISEAIDQTRGWFYSLIAISTLLFDKSPYKNCIVLGLVLDKDGEKMSKHKGNVVDPWTVLNKQGADAVRWYFYISSAPWLPSRFYEEAVSESQRRFLGTFLNTYAFYVLYANIDGFDPTKYKSETGSLEQNSNLPRMDRWILSRLNTLIKYMDESLNSYKLTEAARAADAFVDDLSNWYVRLCRERFWASGMEGDKIHAYMTLYTVLTELAKLVAPFIPFMAEEVYLNLVTSVDKSAPESVHLCDYPVYDEKLINTELEKDMALARDIVALGRAGRNEANIKNRQPLGLMYVKADYEPPEAFKEIIKAELNVKEIVFTENADSFTSYKFKPQLKTLGPRYGKLLPKINQYLQEGDGSSFMAALSETGAVRFTVDGTDVELNKEDVLIETSQKEGYVAKAERGVTVVLKTELTEALIEEGYVRELISKLQTMRKEAGFEVLDRITVSCADAGGVISGVIERNRVVIMKDVLADEINTGNADISGGAWGYSKEWNINGHTVNLSVERSGV